MDGLDVGMGDGWRYGVLFLPSEAGDDDTSAPDTENYLVWTSVSKGGK
jgi:hypothetical protein